MLKIKIIILFFIPLCASAQTPLSLPDAVNIALKNSLDIQLSKNDVEINTINNHIGIAGGLPTVSASASDQQMLTDVKQKLNGGSEIVTNGTSSNGLGATIGASMLLYNGLRVVATKSRLEQLQQVSQEQLNAQVQNIMASVMTAYYDVMRQQSFIKTIDRSIEVSQNKLSIIQTQQGVGLANNADLYQAQVDYNLLLQQKQSQILAINQAKTMLLTLLTLSPDSTINIIDSIAIDKNIVLSDILERVQINPSVLAANGQIKVNEYLVKETAAKRYPSLIGSTGYNYNRTQAGAGNVLLNRSNGPFVGLSLSVPIYNGSVYKRQQQIAEIDVRNAVLDKDILLRDYNSYVVKTYQAYQTTLQQIETQEKTFALSKQLLDLIIKRFQLRQATSVDVRQAQESFEVAGYSLINLNYAAKISEIELKRIANRLGM